MSLTGCPPPALATPVQLAAERVELLAVLSQILEGENAYCANPRLLLVVRFVPELQANPAIERLRALGKATTRDRLIKGIVHAAYGLAVPDTIAALAADLDALSVQWDDLLGGLSGPLTAAYLDMRKRAAPLATGLDPAADIAAMTGEFEDLQLGVLPSLFLPPPQTGRHSVLVDGRGQATVALLYFGFPLDDDPSQFGITNYWLLGGAWHYAVMRFIARYWPTMAAELRALPDVETALTTALAEHHDAVTWPQVVAEHLSIAFKCVLCEQCHIPALVHRSFARTQGMAFFGWFNNWMADIARKPSTFTAEFRRLPQVLAERWPELVACAKATRSGPVSINFALASRRHPRIIVLPDRWDQALCERIARRWALVTPDFVRESAWPGVTEPPSVSLIAFGQIGHDAMIDSLLTRHNLALDKSREGGEVLISLFPSNRAREPWHMAIAVHDPEVAGNFTAENAMGLFHRTARFVGHRFVEGDGIQCDAEAAEVERIGQPVGRVAPRGRDAQQMQVVPRDRA